MKIRLAITALTLALPMASALSPALSAAESAAVVYPRAIVYNPTHLGTPGTRIVGHTRGIADAPLVAALTPADTGETTLAQPTLYWFVSHPVAARIEVALVEEKTQRTILETVVDGPVLPGIQGFPLSVHRIALEPNVEYRWSVSLVRDPAQRSLDLFASGTILRIPLPRSLPAQLNRAEPAELPYALAAAGLWYDALAILSTQITSNPAVPALRAARASLLEQVGLPEAAAFDRAPG